MQEQLQRMIRTIKKLKRPILRRLKIVRKQLQSTKRKLAKNISQLKQEVIKNLQVKSNLLLRKTRVVLIVPQVESMALVLRVQAIKSIHQKHQRSRMQVRNTLQVTQARRKQPLLTLNQKHKVVLVLLKTLNR